MNSLTPVRVYALLILLLIGEVLAAGSGLGLSNALVAIAASIQFGLLLIIYLGVGKNRAWVQLFGWLYLCWLTVMFVFIIGEAWMR